MRQVLASRTVVTGADKQPVGPPPSPEEIADRFPQFEIVECLGRGGMGVVYKARQKSLNRLVAIKILAPERGHESRFAERFAREAELLAKLNHPHIVTIHDFGISDSQPSTLNSEPLCYLVMEFVDGVNLRDLLREGKLEPKQALAIVPPICEALQYAHDKGIVHRDIKPENLLLDREGRIKIADFGIAALMGTEGEEAGTPPYMAPEQSGRSSGIDHRADLYALGVVLYEMLTGERPTTDLVAPSRKVQIDVRLDEMVLRALEKTPELRYQTAAEFRTVVETLAAPAVEQEAANRERRKKRKKKVVFSLPDPLPSKSALLGIAFAAVGVGVLLFVIAAQDWERISRWLSESSEFWRTLKFRPMTIGLLVISLLVAVILIDGLALLIRKLLPDSGSGWSPTERPWRENVGISNMVRMIPKRHRKLVGLTMICVVFISLPYAFGFLGNSATRVRREHGLELPASASHFICGGDAWSVLDRGAASAFEIAPADLPKFAAQLRIRESSSGVPISIFPGNSQYQIRIPWRASAIALNTYLCASRTGDFLRIEVWQIDETRIGICLYTDWN